MRDGDVTTQAADREAEARVALTDPAWLTTETAAKTVTGVARCALGMDLAELTSLMAELGQKGYRARQLFEALYRQRVEAWDEVTVLPVELRARLAADGVTVGLPEIVQTARSVDGTERYLIAMGDGETVETVWMPDGDGGERGDGSDASEEEDGVSADAGVGKQVPRGAQSDRGRRRDASESASRPAQAGPLRRGEPFRHDDQRNVGVLEGRGLRRATICVSSQVGCAVNCQFCLTAKLGMRRNLTAGEIAGQVVAVLRRQGVVIGRDRVNLVFMGMGEPFLNYDAFMKAVRLLVEGVGISESRMTVSTSGIEPAIRRFAMEAVRPKLALSLNASNDAVRERVMPVTRKWGIAALLDAVRTIPLRTREWVTFEYVLLGGVNDRPEHAREVLALLAGMRAKVNLIVWNPGPGIAYEQPRTEDVSRFQAMLIAGGLPTYVRRPRGRDIYAACGQLKRTVEPQGEATRLIAIG